MGYMKRIVQIGLLLAGMNLGLAACGGGGGGAAVVAPPTTAVLKLSSVAKAGQTPQMQGLEVTVLLPQGVTVQTVTSSKSTAANVVRYSGGSAFSNVTSRLFPRPLFGIYSAAKAPGRNGVKIKFATGSATFGAGEFATVICDITAGTTVTPADFSV